MKKSDNAVTINLIGTGCRFFVIRPGEDLLEKLHLTAKKIGSALELAIFDADFFKELGEDKIISISDLSEICIQGLVEDSKSQTEIRIGGRKKRMILLSELTDQQTLIPLFNVEFKNDNVDLKNCLIVTEKEVGVISSFKITTQKIDLDKMKFEMAKIDTGVEKLSLLCNIYYDEQLLKSISNDTLVTSSYAIFIL